MKTIKLLLVATLILAGVSLKAQDNPFTFGVKAGVNMSNLTGDIENNKVRLGYNIGLTLDYSITKGWYILTGIEYTTKGSNFKKTAGVKSSIHAAYLQLPIHAAYKMEVSPNTVLVFRGGPFLAYGVNGDYTQKVGGVKTSSSTFSHALDRFDLGLGLGVGAEFDKVSLTLGWDFGLLDVSKVDGAKIRTGNAYLSAGYRF